MYIVLQDNQDKLEANCKHLNLGNIINQSIKSLFKHEDLIIKMVFLGVV